jgi:hypothetical protein
LKKYKIQTPGLIAAKIAMPINPIIRESWTLVVEKVVLGLLQITRHLNLSNQYSMIAATAPRSGANGNDTIAQ